MYCQHSDIHSRFACFMALCSAIVTISQASYARSAKANEMGVLACGLVLLLYIVNLIGVLEESSTMVWVATNMAMFIHGFQLCYYYFKVLPAPLMIPPLVLGGLFVGFAIAMNCSLIRKVSHKSTATIDLGNEDESNENEFEEIELV